MESQVQKLMSILGSEFFNDITATTSTTTTTNDSQPDTTVTNSKEIHCECKTLILRPQQAKLILPTESMIEKNVQFLQYDGETFKRLVRGCYWLVDDMFKFEQIGYTKEINGVANIKSSDTLRYLVCAECNLGPLGWFDSKTNESYLYVW